MLSDLKERITDFVNGRFPAPPFGDHERGSPRLPRRSVLRTAAGGKARLTRE